MRCLPSVGSICEIDPGQVSRFPKMVSAANERDVLSAYRNVGAKSNILASPDLGGSTNVQYNLAGWPLLSDLLWPL